jgi:hypothetical protein
MSFYRFREVTAILLVIVGLAMLMRGLEYTVRRGLGWQGLVQSGVIGVLVVALGIARWRYLRRR